MKKPSKLKPIFERSDEYKCTKNHIEFTVKTNDETVLKKLKESKECEKSYTIKIKI